ncbi:hypothetical protein M422DRAFT_265711 [Sphaerobolus stellatus SS14]|uniref:DUF6535 domain-containing protein n=1 Tax=Sphaerobolus stellatus (strain SS14) TaxID=990650 RepID=A0A0C9V4X6_SPHS4|nr:hypothetical protein M422DRAFT_265711 [Sphaerobolus stellatus SS14]
MQADLSPAPSDTTNALLMLLIHTIDNATFADQNLTLPQWNGPSSTIIWTQAFAYASLAASLLAAFGAVLGKQWLAHYKSTRFGHGTLEKRGKQREEKYLGIKKWKLDAFLDSLPVLLQLSFLFFGISLSARIGVIFYILTLTVALLFPHTPFENQITRGILSQINSCVILRFFRFTIRRFFRFTIRRFFQITIRYFFRFTIRDFFRHKIPHFFQRGMVLSKRMFHKFQNYDGHPNSAVNVWKNYAYDLKTLDPSATAIQWLMDTSTDPETRTIAVKQSLKVGWSPHTDHTDLYYAIRSLWIHSMDLDNNMLQGFIHFKYIVGVKQGWIGGLQSASLSAQDKGNYTYITCGHVFDIQPETLKKGYDIYDTVKHTFTIDILWVSHILPYDLILSKDGFQGFSQDNKICSDLIEECLRHNEELVIANGLLALALWKNVGDIPPELVSKIDKSNYINTLLGIIAFNLPMSFPSWSESSLIQPFANIYSQFEQHRLLIFPEDKWKDLIIWALDTTQLEVALNANKSSGHLKSVLQILTHANSFRALDYTHTGGTGFKHPVPFQEPLQKACNSLINYAIGIHNEDQDALHNTLLLLSSVDWSNLGSRPCDEFMECLVHTMHSSREALRNAALSVVYALRFQLVLLESSAGLSDRISQALFTVAEPMKVQPADDSSPDPIFVGVQLLHINEYTGMQYAQLIHTLMQQSTWRLQCIRDGHIKAAIVMLEKLLWYTGDRFWWYSRDRFTHSVVAVELISAWFSCFEIENQEGKEGQAEILTNSLGMLYKALSFVQSCIVKHRRWLRIPGFEGKATISPSEILSILTNLLPAISNIVAFMDGIAPESAEPHSEEAYSVMESVRELRSLCSRRPRLLTMVSRPNEFEIDVEEWKSLEDRLFDLAGKFGWTWARESQEDSEDHGEKNVQAITDPATQV